MYMDGVMKEVKIGMRGKKKLLSLLYANARMGLFKMQLQGVKVL